MGQTLKDILKNISFFFKKKLTKKLWYLTKNTIALRGS
ncbi:hypothetical protein [robinz microvirus RP_42]|nr:hypothetical protein [robinz microvirus RP_42]